MIKIEERHRKRDHTTGHMHLNELKILQCDTFFLVKCIHHIHIFLVQKMLAARFITPRIPNYNTDAHREKEGILGRRWNILMRWCPEIGSHISSEMSEHSQRETRKRWTITVQLQSEATLFRRGTPLKIDPRLNVLPFNEEWKMNENYTKHVICSIKHLTLNKNLDFSFEYTKENFKIETSFIFKKKKRAWNAENDFVKTFQKGQGTKIF